jgi:hypothetical protein
MQDPRNLSWNQYNEARKFPLLYNCNPVSTDGNFRLPDDFLVGLYISHNLGTTLADPGSFFIGGITWYGTGVIISVYYRANAGAETKVAETTIDFSGDKIPEIAQLLGYSSSFVSGYIVVGEIGALKEQPTGDWKFNYAATTIDPFCIRFIATELSELYIRNGDKISGPFKGTITLQAGNKITLDPSSPNQEILSCLTPPATSGGTLVTISTVTDDDETENSKFVKTINEVKPDAKGNITFTTGESCLKIAPKAAEHAIEFSDSCTKPCCTCAELGPITEATKTLEASITELRAKIDTLYVQSQLISQAFLAAT